MDISVIINIVLCILSFLLAAISIIFVIITIRQNNRLMDQNNRMIENSTRPYIIMYGLNLNFGTPLYHLVLKNFGQSGAIIHNLYCNYDLLKFSKRSDTNIAPFSNMKNTFLAPGQSISSAIDWKKAVKETSLLNFTIEYSCNGKSYKEVCPVNLNSSDGNTISKCDKENDNIHNISYAIQEYVVRNS